MGQGLENLYIDIFITYIGIYMLRSFKTKSSITNGYERSVSVSNKKHIINHLTTLGTIILMYG